MDNHNALRKKILHDMIAMQPQIVSFICQNKKRVFYTYPSKKTLLLLPPIAIIIATSIINFVLFYR